MYVNEPRDGVQFLTTKQNICKTKKHSMSARVDFRDRQASQVTL